MHGVIVMGHISNFGCWCNCSAHGFIPVGTIVSADPFCRINKDDDDDDDDYVLQMSKDFMINHSLNNCRTKSMLRY